jgi:hypothetical protein
MGTTRFRSISQYSFRKPNKIGPNKGLILRKPTPPFCRFCSTREPNKIGLNNGLTIDDQRHAPKGHENSLPIQLVISQSKIFVSGSHLSLSINGLPIQLVISQSKILVSGSHLSLWINGLPVQLVISQSKILVSGSQLSLWINGLPVQLVISQSKILVNGSQLSLWINGLPVQLAQTSLVFGPLCHPRTCLHYRILRYRLTLLLKSYSSLSKIN